MLDSNVYIARLTYVVMETIEEVEGPQPIAGFENTNDLGEFIRVFEASEGYMPRVYELDSEKDVYHEVNANDHIEY